MSYENKHNVQNKGKFRSLLRVCSVLVVWVVAASAVFSSGAVHAQRPSAAQTGARLDLLSQLNPQAYEAALAATQTYGVDTETGIHLSLVPESVVSTLDPVIWAAMIDHADAIARYLAGNDPDVIGTVQAVDRGTQAVPIGPALRAFLRFVRTNWRPIWDAVRTRTEWAWYKANRCAFGAATSLYNSTGGNPALLASDPQTYLVIAINGCIQHL